MYIKAIKVNPKLLKWAGVALLVLLAVLLTMSFAGSRFSGAPVFSGGVDYKGIKTNEDRVDFIRQFGWEVEEAAVEVTEVTLPEQFDEVYETYNELQKSQGLDLSKYLGETAKRWSYRVLNYPGEQGEVLCNLLICGSRIIACDICKAEMGGFMQGMEMPTPTLEQGVQEGQAQADAKTDAQTDAQADAHAQASQAPVSDGAQAQQAQAGAQASQTAQTQQQPAAVS